MVRDYELMVVVSPQVTDEGVPGALARVNEALAAQGGIVTTTMTNPPWGHRKLAYPIQNFRDAYYAVLHLQVEPSRLDAFERDLKLNDQVLRYLIVRRDEAIRAETKAAARRPVVARPESDEAEGEGDGIEGPE
jgi:small subunit ribosomal protein S6